MPIGEIITAFATPGFVGGATALTLFGACAGAVIDRACLSVWPHVRGEISKRRRRRACVLERAQEQDDLAFWIAREARLIDGLPAETGRELRSWMSEIDRCGCQSRNDRIDWLRQQGFSFPDASWMERIHNNGGRPIYDGPGVHESTLPALCGPAKTVTAPAGVLAAPSASMDAHHGPVRGESVAKTAPARFPGASGADPAPAPAEACSDTWAAPVQSPVDALILKGALPPESRLLLSSARVLVAPHIQVSDFLDYVRAHQLGKCPHSGRMIVTRSCDAWFSAFVKWANARGIEAAPKNTFLKFLKVSPGVEKPRPRIKGVNGNVIRLETPGRSPARKVHYTVVALEAERPAVRRKRAA